MVMYGLIHFKQMSLDLIFLFQIYQTVFVNDTMIENGENSIKHYREKFSQLIEHYKNLRNESISDAGFPPDLFIKENLDVLGKYPVINYSRVYPLQKFCCLMPFILYIIICQRILDAQAYKDAPEMPLGYLSMVYIAVLAPPIFKKIMKPLVLKWNNAY